MEGNGMKILKFTAENVRGIRVVEIAPDGDVVTISGPNGAGKSSVLDSIEATLCGGTLPLHAGSEKGRVEIDLGEYTVSRVITAKTDRLVVKNKDGANYPSPRTFLEKFVGPLSIDPLAFIRLKERDQLEVIFKLCPGLKADLDQANSWIERVKAERSEILKEGTRLRVEIEKRRRHDGVPEEAVDTADLARELEAAQEKNSERKQTARRLESAQDEINAAEVQMDLVRGDIRRAEELIEERKQRLADLEHEKDAHELGAAQLEHELELLTEVDTAPIFERIKSAGEINEKVRQNQELAGLEMQKENASKAFSGKGVELKDAEESKASILEEAELPLAGLGVEAGRVVLHGVPVSELSTSEKVRLGARIAVAQNPKARIILADDVSLLDPENLRILHETASGFQLWEVVNDITGKPGFYIEAGSTGQKEKSNV